MVNLDSANAATPLVICSGMDMKTIYVDHDGKPVDKKSAPGDHAKPCVSAAFNTTPAAQPIYVSIPAALVTAKVFVPEYDNIHTPAFHERPPAIGPPVLL
ncbi:MAG: hypothetical protein JWO78_945 [Micavibrio sp.]|nr:hypothetical protein [Micavibrio sp.]